MGFLEDIYFERNGCDLKEMKQEREKRLLNKKKSKSPKDYFLLSKEIRIFVKVIIMLYLVFCFISLFTFGLKNMELLITYILKIIFISSALVTLFMKGKKFELISLGLIVLTIVSNFVFFL